MIDSAIPPEEFQTLDQLMTKLPGFLAAAPKETGTLDLIVMRPQTDARALPDSVDVSAELGVNGDNWKQSTSFLLEDGSPDPDAQICMMMSGCIEAMAGDKANWAAAGDNFFLDMDLTPANMPPGTRFGIGSAQFIVTEIPHDGCKKFTARYGRDAVMFVNAGQGKDLRLRGIYARVTKDGRVSVGDTVTKL